LAEYSTRFTGVVPSQNTSKDLNRHFIKFGKGAIRVSDY
jgi:hypothetical protein